MAVTELARMLYAANTILEEASKSVALTKRAALALAILHVEGAPMSNQDLVERFEKYNVSTGLSSKKDASAAKGELLQANLIEIRGKLSIFALTPRGREVIELMMKAMDAALHKLRLDSDQRAVFRKIIGLDDSEPSEAKLPDSKPVESKPLASEKPRNARRRRPS
jgi:hypothetical protein